MDSLRMSHGMEQPLDLLVMQYSETGHAIVEHQDLLAMECSMPSFVSMEQMQTLSSMEYSMTGHVATDQPPALSVPEQLALGFPEHVIHFGESPPQSAPASRGLKKRRVCTNEQWEELKPVIKLLWMEEKKTFRQIAKILAEDHGFHPTKRQFDRIVTRWNWRKYIRAEDMEKIVFREQYRSADGRKTAGRINGREVSMAWIARWKRRHAKPKDRRAGEKRKYATPEDMLQSATSSATNMPNIECYTPKSDSDKEPLPYYHRYSILGIADSPKLSRLMESLQIDVEDIPTLQLDSNSEAAASDQFLESATTAGLESDESKSIFEHSASSSLTVASRHASQSSSLVMEISPFPFRLPENSKRPSPVHSSYALRYKMREEIQYKLRFNQLKAASYSNTSPEVLNTLFKLGEVLIEQGVYRDAERIFRHIAVTRERLLTYKDVSTLKAYYHLGDTLYRRVHTRQAQPIIQRLYETTLRTFDPDHEVSVLSTDLMSGYAYRLGDRAKAEMLGRQVLQIRLQKLGPRHESSVQAMYWLGWLLQSAAAVDLCRIALQISNDAGNTLEASAIEASVAMADKLIEQGRMDESLQLGQNSLNRSKRFYGLNHHKTLSCQSDISKTLALMKRYAESEQLSRYTLEQLRNIYKAQGPVYDAVYYLWVSADVLQELNQCDDAEKWYLGIISHWREQNGNCDNSTVNAIRSLGYLYKKQGRFGDAIAIYKQVHEEFEGAGVENKISLSILSALAHGLYKSNYYDDAARCYYRLIEQCSRLLGETHKQTLKYVQWLGECYGDREQYDEQVKACRPIYEILQLSALENEHTMKMSFYFGTSLYKAKLFEGAARCFQSLIEQHERLLGKAHSDTILCYKWLGDCYAGNNQYSQELELYRQKIQQLHSLGIESHPALKILFRLGCAQTNRGNYIDATKTFSTLIEKQERIPGEDHKNTILYYERLGDCYILQKQYKEQLELYQQKSKRLQSFDIGSREKLRIAFLLGAAQFNAGYYQDATESFRALIDKEERLLGPQHKHTLNSHYWLRDCRLWQEMNDLYYEIYKKTATIYLRRCRTNANSDHERGPPLGLLRLFAVFLIEDGLISEAAMFFVRLHNKRKALLGPNNLATIDARAILGWVSEAATEYKPAFWLYQRATDSYRRVESEGGIVDEKIVHWLEEHISQPAFLMKVHTELGSGVESSEGDLPETDESNDTGEESEDSDTEAMWNNYVEFEDLDEILPAHVGVI